MAVKSFSFLVEDLRSNASVRFVIDAEKLGDAFSQGMKASPDFGAKAELRMFRFSFQNRLTGESSRFLGQGATVTEAWGDAVKGTRETFRPKNDGKQRGSNGVCVVLGPGRAAARSIESFEGVETHEQERRRVRLEEERARLAAEGKVA